MLGMTMQLRIEFKKTCKRRGWETPPLGAPAEKRKLWRAPKAAYAQCSRRLVNCCGPFLATVGATGSQLSKLTLGLHLRAKIFWP